MKNLFIQFFSLLFLVSLFSASEARKKPVPLYQNTAKNITLYLESGTKEQKTARILEALLGETDWCDAFIEQCPGMLQGIFTYKDEKHVVGIGCDVSAAKARNTANQKNLEAISNAGMQTFGMFAISLKVKTLNGYFIIALLRKPVDVGFQAADINRSGEDILNEILEE